MELEGVSHAGNTVSGRVLDAQAPEEAWSQERTSQALPPPDQGSRAWLCLVGCFMANVLIWGFAFSYGILQEYYTTHEPFSLHPGGIPAIGTTTTGLSYLTMPIFFLIYRRWPRTRTYSLWLSLPCLMAALIGASFANTVGQLIFCQGVLYSLAGNSLVVPTITYLDEWFIRRKGLAVGIMWSGDGLGGVVMPLLLNAMLGRVGFRWVAQTLRVIACIVVLVMAPLFAFLKPRLPIAAASTTRPIDISFLKGPHFWILQCFNMLQALGYFLPSNYLPTYAQSLGLGSTYSSLTLIMMNLASVFGCITVGALADRFDITNVLLGVSIFASVAVALVWGMALTITPLSIFCIAYGLTAGGYSTTWGGMVKDIQGKYEGVDTSLLFGLLAAGRGIGVVASGPLSEGLIKATSDLRTSARFAYGSDYGTIIIFSACTCIVGGGSWIFRRFGII